MTAKTVDVLIDTMKVFVAGVEAIRDAFDKGLPVLKDALAKAEATRTQLAADRADADTALDRKFGA